MENIAKIFCVGIGMICFIVFVLFAFSLARMASDARQYPDESSPPAEGEPERTPLVMTEEERIVEVILSAEEY